MRWLFVLLVVLNGFYFVWSQLEAPVRPKEIAGAAAGRPASKDIRLLSEGGDGPGCLYLGGYADRGGLAPLLERLQAQGIEARAYALSASAGGGHWARIPPQRREAVDDQVVERLSKDIKDLKRKIMMCEGIATPE